MRKLEPVFGGVGVRQAAFEQICSGINRVCVPQIVAAGGFSGRGHCQSERDHATNHYGRSVAARLMQGGDRIRDRIQLNAPEMLLRRYSGC